MTVVTDNLLDSIRAGAFAEMDEDIPLEEVKGQIIDNTETIKKIEEARVFVSMERQGVTGEGLKQASIPSKTTTSTTTSSSSSTYNTSNTYKPYQSYPTSPYMTKVETLDQKACESTSALFKKLDERAKARVTNRSKANVTNWTMLQSIDECDLAKREGKKVKKKKLTKGQARAKIFMYQMILACIKGAMESLFVSTRERK
jgi:hypothetical protein